MKQERQRREKEHQDQLFETLMNGIAMPKEQPKPEPSLIESRTAQFSSYGDEQTTVVAPRKKPMVSNEEQK